MQVVASTQWFAEFQGDEESRVHDSNHLCFEFSSHPPIDRKLETGRTREILSVNLLFAHLCSEQSLCDGVDDPSMS